MNIGTKSLLYGAHCWFIHPWFVAWAWWKLYGFPRDWRLWVCFMVHDWGYWGLPNMDGKEGENHPIAGARIAHVICEEAWEWEWYMMCVNHSRYLANRHGKYPSQLCYADKLAFSLTPFWLYLPLVWLTGEWKEYVAAHSHEGMNAKAGASMWEWYWKARRYTKAWVDEHKSGKEDTWTKPKPR